ncbi:hypothetical protein MWN63_02795 [Paradonghicola geojensis]|nr:hypothetical protein [Marivivens geojensis]
MNQPATARISVLTNGTRIGKVFDISPAGELVKTPNGAFTKGTIEVMEIPNSSVLADLCDGLTSKQALCLGGPKNGQPTASITTREDALAWKYEGSPPLTRTKDDLEFFPGEGFALLDYDDKDLPGELRKRIIAEGGAEAVIYQLYPALFDADRLVRPSSSSGVYRCGQEQVQHSCGFHMLVRLEEAEDTPRLIEALRIRCWDEGLGYVAISKAGTMLERFIVDGAVGSPERLIYTATPILGPGVCREPSLQRVALGDALETPVLASGTGWTRKRALAFENQREAADAVRAHYITARASDLSSCLGISLSAATKQVHATVNGFVIHDDYILELSNGQNVRVGDMLDAACPGLKLSCADPIEGRSYGRTTASVLWGSDYDSPVLVSHAHGQKTVYRFARHDFNTIMKEAWSL